MRTCLSLHSLCYFSRSSPNISHRNLSTNIINLCFSLSVRLKMWHIQKKERKIYLHKYQYLRLFDMEQKKRIRMSVPWWASNPNTWTGYETMCFMLNLFIPSPPLCLTAFTWDGSFYHPLWSYLLKHPLTTVKLVSAVQPKLEYTYWANIGSRFGSTGSVISSYVYSGLNKSFVCPEIFVNK